MDADRHGGHRVAHQSNNARIVRARAEDAAWMKTERVLDRARQFADVDATGLGQVGLPDSAGERLRGEPDVLRQGTARRNVLFLIDWCRTGPVLQRGDRLGLGHALDPHQPVHAAAVFAAAEAMPMVRVDLAARPGIVMERAGHVPTCVHWQGDEVGERGHCLVQAGEKVLLGATFDLLGVREPIEPAMKVSSAWSTIRSMISSFGAGGSPVAGAVR